MLTCPDCGLNWYALAELADRYGVDGSTVRYWRIQGKFPNAQAVQPTGPGHVWLVPETDLEHFTPPRRPGH